MRLSNLQIFSIALVLLLIAYFITYKPSVETYLDYKESSKPRCNTCGSNWPCSSCKSSDPIMSIMPDMTKYVLKSTIPPCPMLPDMSQYILKTECPPTPDLSKYVLKSSVPKQQPVFLDTSNLTKDMCGECPPCPRPRCPDIKCPPPTKCSPPAPCPRPVCPPQVIKCKAEESVADTVRPFLAPLSSGYASAF